MSNTHLIAEQSSDSEEITSEDFFYKDTESFKCLAQVFVSRSSVFRHPLYPFPPLTDPGLDEAINYEEPIPETDVIGVDTYVKLRQRFNICSFRRILRSLSEDTLNLKYYGLQEKQVEALMAALSKNVYVLNLILQDNWLTPKSVEHLSNMLSTNHTLSLLNLKECRIQSEGAEILNEGLVLTISLRELDLSYNSLDDVGLTNLVEGLTDNKSIRILNLSHNNLGEGAAEALYEIISNNEFIEDLDLSWNNFYSAPGNTILFNGFMRNTLITKLNIAWNGIATKDATKPIMKYLKAAEHLVYFDISGNRLTTESFSNIRNGLSKCSNFQYLKIGSNLLKPEEALSVGRLINSLKMLKDIYMENTFVTKDFLPIMKQAQKRAVRIVIEGILGNYVLAPVDQIILLFKRAKFLGMKAKSKKKQIDFGHFILSLPEEDLLPADFALNLKKFKLKLDKELVQDIVSNFPAPKGKVSCINMKNAYLGYYPDTTLPEPKPAKAKKEGKVKPKMIIEEPHVVMADMHWEEEEYDEEYEEEYDEEYEEEYDEEYDEEYEDNEEE